MEAWEQGYGLQGSADVLYVLVIQGGVIPVDSIVTAATAHFDLVRTLGRDGVTMHSSVYFHK